MKTKNPVKTIVIIGAIVLVILLGAMAAVLLLQGSGDQAYERQIALAEQYLAAGDLDSAISAYYTAIDMNAGKEKAYDGLATIYQRRGEVNMLDHILRRGYSSTGSQLLLTRLNNIEESLVESKTDEGETIALNDALLTRMGSFTFAEYTAAYSRGTMSSAGGQRTMTASLSQCVTYSNAGITVYAGPDGVMESNVPSEIHLTTLEILFMGMDSQISYQQLQDLRLNELTTMELNGIGRVVSFLANSCQIYIACDGEGNVTADAWNCIIPLVTRHEAGAEEEEPSGNTFTLSGRINDATTGTGISNVQLKVYQNNTVIQEISGDYSGSYRIEGLESGNYVVELSARGYITVKEDVFIGRWLQDVTQNFVLSPELSAGEIRIVLTWDAAPRDLDSHLRIEGTNSWVFFGNSRYTRADGTLVAELDVDDRDGYGPETTTIYDISGSYHFMVADFNQTGMIGSSGATVQIYIAGQAAPTVIHIDPSITKGWDVCTINNGTVTVINKQINDIHGY